MFSNTRRFGIGAGRFFSGSKAKTSIPMPMTGNRKVRTISPKKMTWLYSILGAEFDFASLEAGDCGFKQDLSHLLNAGEVIISQFADFSVNVSSSHQMETGRR